MKILAIETSCDETAISIIEAAGGFEAPQFQVLSHLVSSQVKLHAQWGGVVPSLAKREHGKNLVPLLEQAISESNIETKSPVTRNTNLADQLSTLLDREGELKEILLERIGEIDTPQVDVIAVTYGPGLEPALWVGINFARALGLVWNLAVIPINHMEGHIFSPLLEHHAIHFPALALLISGGHTELVLMRDWLKYEVIGQTRDDAVGEAFDKVARLLDLPYPGGPEISKLADKFKEKAGSSKHYHSPKLPRPMLHSDNFDFSFSGLKTAVLYTVKKIEKLDDDTKAAIAKEFQDACIEVLLTKTMKAIEQRGAKSLIIGGGVISNTALRQSFAEALEQYPEVSLLIPARELATDNATMIALAAYFRHLSGNYPDIQTVVASGNLVLK
jgi:N6-L-threonylcarbamoyladenine synthase